jgi:hypothetical protein
MISLPGERSRVETSSARQTNVTVYHNSVVVVVNDGMIRLLGFTYHNAMPVPKFK